MKQKVLKLMCLLCVCMMGASAWASQVEVTYKLTIQASDFNSTSYAANNNEKTSQAVCTTDATKKFEVQWTSNQVMLLKEAMQWQKNAGYIYNSTDLTNIKSVTVTSTAGTFTTYYGTNAQPSSGTEVGTNNGFFKVSVGNATGTSSKIEVTFSVMEGADTRLEPTLSFSSAEVIATTEDDGIEEPTLSSNSTGEVTYSSSNMNVATVNASTGKITLTGEAGTTTITANVAETTEYKAGSASYTLTVKKVYADGYVHDVLTLSTTGVSGTSYTTFEGKTVTSTAVYEGQCAGGNSSIQLRAQSPAGIITTTTGGYARKVTVTWNSNTQSGRTLDIYGSNTAYATNSTPASALYNGRYQGTKLGSIVYGTSTELDIDGDYAYIGIRSNDKALYLDEIDIAWETTYTRDVTSGDYGTLCLPFSVTDVAGADVYSIAGVIKSGDDIVGVSLEEVTCPLAAGTPYIFKATDNKIEATYGTGYVTDAATATGLVGNLSATPVNVPVDGKRGIVYGKKILLLAEYATATVGQNRAYINLNDVTEPGSGVKGIRLYFDGTEESTGIENLTPTLSKGEGAIYNLNGQRMETLQKGINIVGGKKVVIK